MSDAEIAAANKLVGKTVHITFKPTTKCASGWAGGLTELITLFPNTANGCVGKYVDSHNDGMSIRTTSTKLEDYVHKTNLALMEAPGGVKCPGSGLALRFKTGFLGIAGNKGSFCYLSSETASTEKHH